MQQEELKSLQVPLKERYREDPSAALITLHADGRLGEGVMCSLETGKALVTAGLHPAPPASRLACGSCASKGAETETQNPWRSHPSACTTTRS